MIEVIVKSCLLQWAACVEGSVAAVSASLSPSSHVQAFTKVTTPTRAGIPPPTSTWKKYIPAINGAKRKNKDQQLKFEILNVSLYLCVLCIKCLMEINCDEY